jgi:histidinol-phosphatase (PHP family)
VKGGAAVLDYHVHTVLCRHAEGTLEEYLAEAERKGLTEIGFADHFPLGLLDYTPRTQVTMDPDELKGYMDAVRRLSDSSGKVAVKLGIEVDYLPDREEKLRDQLDRYPFDYIIGSVHFMDGWDFTHPRYAQDYHNHEMGLLYRRYFQLVQQACQSGLFDIIGHVDVIKKFGFRPPEDLEPFWIETARLLRETGTAIELNTAGRDAPVEEFYPDRRLLEICCVEGVSITLGSDAHSPEQVGRYFTAAAAMLKEAGCRELASYSMRRRTALKLEGD